MMCVDLPNAFIQCPLPRDKKQEKIVMKISGVLVDLLVEASPTEYAKYVVYENGIKVLYVEVL